MNTLYKNCKECGLPIFLCSIVGLQVRDKDYKNRDKRDREDIKKFLRHLYQQGYKAGQLKHLSDMKKAMRINIPTK